MALYLVRLADVCGVALPAAIARKLRLNGVKYPPGRSRWRRRRRLQPRRRPAWCAERRAWRGRTLPPPGQPQRGRCRATCPLTGRWRCRCAPRLCQHVGGSIGGRRRQQCPAVADTPLLIPPPAPLPLLPRPPPQPLLPRPVTVARTIVTAPSVVLVSCGLCPPRRAPLRGATWWYGRPSPRPPAPRRVDHGTLVAAWEPRAARRPLTRRSIFPTVRKRCKHTQAPRACLYGRVYTYRGITIERDYATVPPGSINNDSLD